MAYIFAQSWVASKDCCKRTVETFPFVWLNVHDTVRFLVSLERATTMRICHLRPVCSVWLCDRFGYRVFDSQPLLEPAHPCTHSFFSFHLIFNCFNSISKQPITKFL